MFLFPSDFKVFPRHRRTLIGAVRIGAVCVALMAVAGCGSSDGEAGTPRAVDGGGAGDGLSGADIPSSDAGDAGTGDVVSGDAVSSDAGVTTADVGAPLPSFEPKGFNESKLGGGWLAAGQPSKTRFLEVLAKGATVITLRYKSEEAFDEAALAKSYGNVFIRYAVQSANYAKKDFRTKLWDLYDAEQAKGGLVYLHCASSNRVGASWALYQWERKGKSKSAALALGTKAGMKSASAVVKQVMGL